MFRNKNFISSLLNVLGMTAAFAALYVILVQVHHDFSYNKGLKDHERICAVSIPSWYDESRYMVYLNRPMHENLISSVSEFEAGGHCYLQRQDAQIYLASGTAGEGEAAYDREMLTSLSAFSDKALEVFGVEFIRGTFEDVLPNQNHMAVSESAAKRMGLDLGSTFMLAYGGYKKQSYEVKAIYKDMPRNTDFDSFEMFYNASLNSLEDWTEWSYPYFVKLTEGVTVEQAEAACMAHVENYFSDKVSDSEEMKKVLDSYRYRLVPIADAYFDRQLDAFGAKGNKTTTVTLLAIAVLVILIALINYVNFFFAMIPIRIKAVNTRKILGSSRGKIVWTFIRESLMMITASLTFAAAVVLLFRKSSLADLISCDMSFIFNAGVSAVTICIALLISVVASIYPALYITSFPPALVIRGSFGASSKGKTLRYFLIGLQFVISMGLIICALFINMQRSYMMNHDMGFNRENLLTATVSWPVAYYSADAVTNTLDASPLIKDVTWANGDIVVPARMGWGRDFKGEVIHFQCYPVAWDFLRFMGVEIIEGRDFTQADELSETGVFIFNRKARDEFGLTLEDKVMGHMDVPAEIAGFCENFNFMPLQSEIEPFCLYIFGTNAWRKNNTLFVRTQEGTNLGDALKLVRDAIAEVDKETSYDEINVEIFDSQLARSYYKEENLSKLITLFTVLAIIISLMGVFGLVMFETEYRRKEIGVRRVNGATVHEILAMFNVKFVRIVLICFVVAAPLSWFIMDRYLEDFAYRVPLYVWVFVLALLAVLAVTVGVVTLRSWRASTQNPVDALRNE